MRFRALGFRVWVGYPYSDGLCNEGIMGYVGGCQNYGPVLGPYYNTAPII